MEKYDINKNSYDIIRLFAAIQVVIGHINTHIPWLSLTPKIMEIISAFPGVPIFFALSGYFTCYSIEKKTKKEFVLSRFLRLYPMLWFVQFVCFILIKVANDPSYSLTSVLKYVFCQITIFNDVTPSFYENFGTGVVNGALWTIPVEVLFYVFLALIYERVIQNDNRHRNLRIIFGSSILIAVGVKKIPLPNVVYLCLRSTFLPYLYIFMTGIIFYQYKEVLTKYIKTHRMLFSVLLTCGVTSYLILNLVFDVSENCLTINYGLTRGLLLPTITLFWGQIYTARVKIDLTYYVYLVHMLVISSVVEWNLFNGDNKLFVILIILMVCFLFSLFMNWLYSSCNRLLLSVRNKDKC